MFEKLVELGQRIKSAFSKAPWLSKTIIVS